MKKSVVAIEKAEKQAIESQFTISESEKITLTRLLEEAKATLDEAVAMATSLQSKQERLVRVAEAEVVEKLT